MAAKPRAPSEAARLEEPLQKHRREDAKQHRDHKRQPTGHRPLPLTLALPQIAFRAFAFMPLHTLLMKCTGPKHKTTEPLSYGAVYPRPVWAWRVLG
jgi:hypothetical protein